MERTGLRAAIPAAIVRTMTRRTRLLMFAGVVALAFVVAIFVVGGQVGSCLGPLGVTEVQCIRATGITPTVGIALPIILALVALAALALFPVPRSKSLWAAIGGIAGAIVAAIGYLAFHPTSITGPTSTGEVITVQLPIDGPALVGAVVAGAAVVALLAGHLRRRDAATPA